MSGTSDAGGLIDIDADAIDLQGDTTATGGNIDLNTDVGGIQTAALTTATSGNIVTNSAMSTTIGSQTSVGTITNTAGTDLTVTGASAANGDVRLVSQAGNMSLNNISSGGSILGDAQGDITIAGGAVIQNTSAADALIALRAGGSMSAGAGSSVTGSTTTDVYIASGVAGTNGTLSVNNVTGRDVRLSTEGTGDVTVSGAVSASRNALVATNGNTAVSGSVTAGQTLQVFSAELDLSGSLVGSQVDIVSTNGAFELGDNTTRASSEALSISNAEYARISADTLSLYAPDWSTAMQNDGIAFGSLSGASYADTFYVATRPADFSGLSDLPADLGAGPMDSVQFVVGDLSFTSTATNLQIFSGNSGNLAQPDVLVEGAVTNGGVANTQFTIGQFDSPVGEVSWRPGVVFITGSIGANSINPANGLSAVTDEWIDSIQIAADSVIIGNQAFYDDYVASVQGGTPQNFRPSSRILTGTERTELANKVWLAANTLQFKVDTSGGLVQLNTAVGLPSYGLWALTPDEQSELVQLYDGTRDGLDVPGPQRIELFGIFADRDNTSVLTTGIFAAQVPLLTQDNAAVIDDYRFNGCSFYTTSCSTVLVPPTPQIEDITDDIIADFSSDEDESRDAEVGLINTEALMD